MKRVISTICIALCAGAASAQVVSGTSLFVGEGAVLSIGQDFENKGELINNGKIHFQKDINNLGSIESKGTVVFDGYGKQTVAGQKELTFNKVELQNDVELGSTLIVGEEFNFQNGVLRSSEKSPLVFASSANHFGASDYSHVVGSVKKMNAAQFEFPLGDGSMYRSFNAEGNNGTLVGSYVAQNPLQVANKFETGVDYINDYEYWTLKSEKNNQTADITIDNYSSESIAYLNRGSWSIAESKNFDTKKGLNNGLIFTSGKGRFITKEIGIWPNPTQGEFNLKLTGMNDTDEVSVDITNVDGRVVLRAQGLVRDLRKVYELPVSLVTTELTVRVINGDEVLSDKLVLNR
ncbi:hypothetical protein SAMN06298216_1062 [Spirosomataceae bacterium TFI 002]|nr:hypothetical protein SAMN06298216_1062 [Spirosomataceae bacterium TFI 002]